MEEGGKEKLRKEEKESKRQYDMNPVYIHYISLDFKCTDGVLVKNTEEDRIGLDWIGGDGTERRNY